MPKPQEVQVIKTLSGETLKFDSKHYSARFTVRPPLRRIETGKMIRLHDDEGWIEVRCVDSRIQVMGAHPFAIEPISSNCVSIKLTDDA